VQGTLYDMFFASVARNPNNECLGWRTKNADGSAGEFQFLSYAQVAEQVNQIASGMAAIGASPQKKIGIFGANSPSWMMTMQACNRMSNMCVPLYDSLGENAVEYIVDHAECTCVFLSSDKFPQLVKALDKITGPLKTIVYWGTSNPGAHQAVKDKGLALYSLEEFKKMGAEKPAEPVPPSPEDLSTIMYTSGTTGDPKGVMLSHRAIVGAVTNAATYLKRNNLEFSPPDRLLSYLPLAHIFDRVIEEWFLSLGCAIGYWQGDVGKLVDDIAALKPAMFFGVPRVFDRIYSRIDSQIKNGGLLTRALFHWGYQRKLYFMQQGFKQSEASPFCDKLLFSKIAARLGGKVKAVVSGGAPLAPHVEEFLRVTMCAPVAQGYGLTETCAVSFVSSVDFFDQSATVGPPCPLTELQLESVPELNYDATTEEEPKGEILIRSANNFSGYYKAQDKTDEVLDKDGFFHTGDIGCLTKSGGLQIIDRKKNIFKLGQGEYVAVEKLELAYKKCPLVDQVWVYGNSFKNTLVAVVVPNMHALKPWAESNGISGDDHAVCANPKVKEHVLKELVATGRAEKLKGFEIIKNIHLDTEPFSIEDDTLTPTFKLKRPQLLKKYKQQVDAMYKAME